MKKSIVILIFFITLGASAQGNLQFNKAKLVSTIETVPVGKVWKVESASYGGGNAFAIGSIANTAYGTAPISSLMNFKINGLNNFLPALGQAGGVSSIISFPIWLPEGSTLEASTNTNFLSVIEFNIVQ